VCEDFCNNQHAEEVEKLKGEINNKQILLQECFDKYIKQDRKLRMSEKYLAERQQKLKETQEEG
jgi:hypothetical protein